jgi:hypothetical protein
VESLIRAPIDRVWDVTQRPEQHQRWDARFGSIAYLPLVEGESQKFTYATTVARGLTISGTGESLGDRDRAEGSTNLIMLLSFPTTDGSVHRPATPTTCAMAAPCSSRNSTFNVNGNGA